MLSNQVLQKALQDMSQITGHDCSVWNTQIRCLTATGELQQGVEEKVQNFIKEAGNKKEWIEDDEALFLVEDEHEPAYVFVLHGIGQTPEALIRMAGGLCTSQFENLIHAYKERLDRNRFVQNLLLDNLLLVDIYNQAQKLRIAIEQRRAVFLIEPKQEGDNLVLETLKGLYATGTRDFVTAVDEKRVILVKTIETTETYEALYNTANIIVDTLNAEAMVNVRVAYGTIVEDLKDVSKSYKEADMALDVGRIFYEERNVLAYKELGIGRLIHQLPISLCEMFLDEVFAGRAVSQFDEETLSTVSQFFEHNLNISETARQLYVHRNTLVYRLEKIQKTTGLDVRIFEDALTFKIALMVADHIRQSH